MKGHKAKVGYELEAREGDRTRSKKAIPITHLVLVINSNPNTSPFKSVKGGDHENCKVMTRKCKVIREAFVKDKQLPSNEGRIGQNKSLKNIMS